MLNNKTSLSHIDSEIFCCAVHLQATHSSGVLNEQTGLVNDSLVHS